MSEGVDGDLLRRRHHLPHWQRGGSYYWVTIRCLREALCPESRQLVIDTMKRGHGLKFELVAAVVMPDHMHLILYPLPAGERRWHDLAGILKAIKGASARHINLAEGTRGSVWHEESHDRIIRNDEEFQRFVDYLVTNPVRRELVTRPEDYPHTIWPGDLMDYRPWV